MTGREAVVQITEQMARALATAACRLAPSPRARSAAEAWMRHFEEGGNRA